MEYSWGCSSVGEHLLCKQGARGSTPSPPPRRKWPNFQQITSAPLRFPPLHDPAQFKTRDRIESSFAACLPDYTPSPRRQVAGLRSCAKGAYEQLMGKLEGESFCNDKDSLVDDLITALGCDGISMSAPSLPREVRYPCIRQDLVGWWRASSPVKTRMFGDCSVRCHAWHKASGRSAGARVLGIRVSAYG